MPADIHLRTSLLKQEVLFAVLPQVYRRCSPHILKNAACLARHGKTAEEMLDDVPPNRLGTQWALLPEPRLKFEQPDDGVAFDPLFGRSRSVQKLA